MRFQSAHETFDVAASIIICCVFPVGDSEDYCVAKNTYIQNPEKLAEISWMHNEEGIGKLNPHGAE